MSRHWKNKFRLAGLLHDPIDKTLKIRGHASRAAEIARSMRITEDVVLAIKNHHSQAPKEHLSPSAEEIHRVLRNSDMHASIANRIIILDYHREDRSRGHLQESKIHLIHPFSGYAYYFPKEVLQTIEAWQKSELPNISPEVELDSNVLLSLLLKYYNSYGSYAIPIQRWLLHLPEDTRSPISSIFSHLEITGALAKLFSEGEFWLVYYNIGGVQEFIASARKTMDLWAGSYIMSLLSFCILKKVANTIGYEHIILPWYPALPLGLLDLGFDVDPKDLILPVTPNSALILLPKEIPTKDKITLNTIDDIYSFIFGEMKRCWEIIKEKAKHYLQNKLKDKKIKQRLDEIFDSELAFEKVFKNIRVVAVKIKFSNEKLMLEDDLGEIIEKIYDCTLGSPRSSNQDCEYKNLEKILNEYKDYLAYVPKGLKQDFFFPALIKLVRLIMGIGSERKVRGNYNYSMDEKMRQELSIGKCTMCGLRDAIFDRESFDNRSLKDLDYNERLCAVDIIKRVFRSKINREGENRGVFEDVLKEILNDESDGQIKERLREAYEEVERIPSTDDIAQGWYRYVLSQAIKMSKDIESVFNEIKKIISDIKGLLTRDLIEDLEIDLSLWKYDEESLTSEDRRIKYTVQRLVETLGKIYRKLSVKDTVSMDNIPAELLDRKLLDELLGLFNEKYLEIVYGESGIVGDMQQIKNYLVGLSSKLRDLSDELKRFLDDPNNRKEIAWNIIKSIASGMTGASSGSIEDSAYYYLLMDYLDMVPLPYEPQDTFAVLAMDGDNMSKWISGELNIPLVLTFGRLDYLQELSRIFSGDTNLNEILVSTRALMTPSLLTTLSMIISLNSREVLRIIRAFGGFLIYSGGDDVLALLPPEPAHLVALILRVIFSREFIETEYLGRQFRIYGLGWRASASAAIFYADTKYDFRDAIMRTHSLLEGLAKKYNPLGKGLFVREHEKDGLALALASRSQIIAKTTHPLPQFLIVSGEQESMNVRTIKAYYDELTKDLKAIANRSDMKRIVQFFESRIQSDGLLSIKELYGDKVFVGIEPSFLNDSLLEKLRGLVSGDTPKVYSSILAIYTIEGLIKAGLLSNRFIYEAREHFLSFMGNSDRLEALANLDELFWRLLQRLISRKLPNIAKKKYGDLSVDVQKLLSLYISHVEPTSFLEALKIIDRVLDKSFFAFELGGGEDNAPE